MFGAESILFERCADEAVFRKAVKMIEDFKGYFTSHGQVVYENPSPGNKAGGITTLEDKSCGCVQKGGLRPDRRRAGLRRGCHKEGAEPVVRTGQRPGVRHRPHRRRGSPDPVHHRQGYPLRCPRPHGEDLHQHRPLWEKAGLDRLQRRNSGPGGEPGQRWRSTTGLRAGRGLRGADQRRAPGRPGDLHFQGRRCAVKPGIPAGQAGIPTKKLYQ